MKTIRVNAGNVRYPVNIGDNIQEHLAHYISMNCDKASRVVIITNQTIECLYPDYLTGMLDDHGRPFEKIIIKDGEEYKNPDTLDHIYERLLSSGIHRDDIMIAFGGGVVGDLSGFAAATYNRGTGFIQVPTTIIGQVDSSIGGKVGINYRKVKNIIGTFYQPDAVFIDPGLLQTLDEKQIINGSAEIVKYALLFDSSILKTFRKKLDKEDNGRLMSMVSSNWFHQVITSCVKMKSRVVAKDVYDQGYRNLLNFGHTVGHGLEKAFKLDRVAHGEAVAIGMLVAMDISISMGLLKPEVKYEVLEVYKLLKLPRVIPRCGIEDIMGPLRYDKKTAGGKNRFILLKGINRPIFYNNLDKEVIIDNIKKSMYNYI